MATIDEINNLISSTPALKTLAGLQESIAAQPGLVTIAKQFAEANAPLAAIAAQHKALSFPVAAFAAQHKAFASPFADIASRIKPFNIPGEGILRLMDTIAGPSKAIAALVRPQFMTGLTLHDKIQAAFVSAPAQWENTGSLLPAGRFVPPPSFITDLQPAPSNRTPQRRQPAAPADFDLLPPDVAQSRVYFAQLISELRKSPAPDIILVLDYQFSQHEERRGLFLDRLTHYLASGEGFAPACWQVLAYWLSNARRETGHTRWETAPADLQPKPARIEQTAGRLESHLLNYSAAQLHELLRELGLVNATGRATAAATPGAWVGVVYGLLNAQPPRLRGSKASIRRALSVAFDANVSERALQYGLGTNGSEAEQFRNRTLKLLAQA